MAEHGKGGRKRGILRVRATGSTVVREILLPAQAFIQTEGRSGIFLLAAAVTALLWANSPWANAYFALWEAKAVIDLGILTVALDLRHWVNDGLMTVFFFVVGLEIKREMVHGELSDPREAALPLAAALGGMLVPAATYAALNAGSAGAAGWGIPMATDIAFALGVLALLGPRIPSEVRIFLLALAVVDDVGAILVIAIFYTQELHPEALVLAAVLVGTILAMQRIGIRTISAYLVPGTLLWLAVHESGVHATIAGVVLALLTPSEPFFTPQSFAEQAADLLERLRTALSSGDGDETNAVLGELEEVSRLTESPVERLERRVHPWSNYVILPLFALANAGLTITAGTVYQAISSRVTLGIVLGLTLGKPLGVAVFSWIAARSGLARLPAVIRWSHILGAGAIAGIGFTVSLFIAGLAFTDPALVGDAKIGILVASLLAGALGYGFLLFGSPKERPGA